MKSSADLPSLVILLALTGALTVSSPALAETQIGSAKTVVRDVTGTLGDEVRTIVIRDNVFQNELIETSAESAAEIVFLDGTKVSVGPNARLVLDEFVYNPDKKSGAFKMNLLQGAAKFVTGNLSSKDKSNFEIATPTVTIAVRGTTLDVVVDLLGATATRLDSQSIIDIANEIGVTVQLNLPDTAATSTPAGDFEDSQHMPEWAMAAIRLRDDLLENRPRDSENFAVAPPPPTPPTPPQPQVVPPPPPPPPEDPDEQGLDQAQSVASDTALNGGLTNNAVGVADHSAQGLSRHGSGARGGSGSSSSGGGGRSGSKGGGGSSASSGGSNSSSASGGGGSHGKSGSRGRRGGGGQE